MKSYKIKITLFLAFMILISAVTSIQPNIFAESTDAAATEVSTDFPVANPQNLAIGMKAVSSGVESSVTQAPAVTDGNTFTRWASKHTDASWIYIDLIKARTFNKIVLNWETAYAKAFKIQISNDARKWTDIYSTTDGHDYIFEIETDYKTARYVRMLGIKRATKYGYSLYEFGIYKDDYSIKELNKKSENIVWEGYVHTYSQCVNLGRKVVVLEKDGAIRTSEDNIHWKTIRLGDKNIIQIMTVADKFVAVSTSGNMFYSNDGTLWKSSLCNLSGRVRSIQRANNRVFLIMWDKKIYCSADGVSWDKLQLDIGKRAVYSIRYEKGFYEVNCNIVLRYDHDSSDAKMISRLVYGDYKFVSGDLVKWNEVDMGEKPESYYSKLPTNTSEDISIDDITSMSSENGGILYGNQKDLAFDRVINTGKLFVAIGNVKFHDSMTHYLSVDGFKWVRRDFSAAYNGVKFIGLANSELLESEDALHWTKMNNSDHKGFTGIYSCNNVFLANSNGGDIFVSGDGYEWKTSDIKSFHILSSGKDGAFVEGIFPDNKIYFSMDGIHWSSFENPVIKTFSRSDAYLDNVLRDGDQYISLLHVTTDEHRYIIYTSKDLKAWEQFEVKEYDTTDSAETGISMYLGEYAYLTVSRNGTERTMIGRIQ